MAEKRSQSFYRDPVSVLKLMGVIWAIFMAVYALKYDSPGAGITFGLLVIAYFIVSALKGHKAD